MIQQNTENTEDQNTPNKSKRKWTKYLIILACLFGFFLLYNTLDKIYRNTLVNDSDATTVGYVMNYNLKEYDNINEDYRNCIHLFYYDKQFENGLYFLSQIPNRAKKVYTFGDFSNKQDNNKDLAILLEKNDYKSSLLLLISNDCSVIYSKEYDYELPTISAFAKGQKIFLNNTELENAPSDGVMLHFKFKKTALLYIPESKTFEEYTQYSNDDLKNMENEGEEGDYEESENPNGVVYRINDPDGYANLREQKDTTSLILQKINSGTEIIVLDDTEDWWEVETGEGKKGYVHKSKIASE